jgi:hypothetical protein
VLSIRLRSIFNSHLSVIGYYQVFLLDFVPTVHADVTLSRNDPFLSSRKYNFNSFRQLTELLLQKYI